MVCVCDVCACRESGQSTADDLKGKDFRQELEEKEHFSRDKREKRSFTG